MTDRPGISGRRRTILKSSGTNLLGPSKKQSGTGASETTGTIDVIHRPSHCRLENNYRLGPAETGRFQAHKVEQAIKEVLQSRLAGLSYDHSTCNALSKELVADIHRRVKDFNWRRYRLVCHVTLGQDTGQGTQVASRCLWDAKHDSYGSVRYSNNNLFAVAQCYGVYFE
ncbi:TCTEX1 domain-containing protein 1 [Plakobranchus ocellatus]|uniref:TCTEX1 domain-containing protein 1 n=1 Tax=Plakobranchus ocellatus TaxID=259542 RepID=A0AAV3YLI8_9GAST|nr:TCTEX1 domain-containing protein 1 [Plakobranchus ocellatus]